MWIELTRYVGGKILVNTDMLSNIESKDTGCLLRGNSTTRSITVRESYEDIKKMLLTKEE